MAEDEKVSVGRIEQLTNENAEPLNSKLTKVRPAALVEVAEGKGIMLRSLQDLINFSQMLVAEGAAPKGMTYGSVAIAIQAGMERGLGPLGGLQNGVVINGRFSWNGQGAFSLIQNSGKCKPGTLKKWVEGEGDEMTGYAEGWRVGYPEPDQRSFSVKEAKRAGLWGKDGPWRQYPERQLQWRAFGFLARDIFPDVLGGFPLAEELVDYADVQPVEPKVSRLGAGASKVPKPADPLEDLLPDVPAPPTKAESVEDDPPFASHEEADREIAKQEGLF